MPEDVFRVVVAAAVAVAALAFVAQAAMLAAVYRSVRKMQQTAEPLAERAGPVIDKLGPAIESIQDVAGKAASAFEKAAPAIEKAGAVLERAGRAIEKAELAIERGGLVLDSARGILDESGPRISEITGDVAAVTRTGREQAERVGELLRDAGDRARARLDQIDRSVEGAVEQVGQMGDAVKRAALRPVREVSGIAAGVSAAFSTLMRGRKSSVESATQDEEMFI